MVQQYITYKYTDDVDIDIEWYRHSDIINIEWLSASLMAEIGCLLTLGALERVFWSSLQQALGCGGEITEEHLKAIEEATGCSVGVTLDYWQAA